MIGIRQLTETEPGLQTCFYFINLPRNLNAEGFFFHAYLTPDFMSKILLIEDDSKIRAILREILQDKNHEVDEAADGWRALKNSSRAAYDLCICDIKMPKMDGMEVLEKAKEAESSDELRHHFSTRQY
jgi:PleD family two-component response regulator